MKKIPILTLLLLPMTARGFLQLGIARRWTFLRQVSSSTASATDAPSLDSLRKFNGTVTILDHGADHLVVAKPPSVLCHHSDWAGSRSQKQNKKRQEPEIPMLQRVRNALGERVNVIHRLDRGCSGCLLFAHASSENATAILSKAMALPSTTKTYLALVRGEGILHGRDFRQEEWFPIDRPIKNERGTINNATTHFNFIAGQDSITNPNQPRASLVLARPSTGRWHQIRRHLNGLSHPILGDSTHGNTKVNREWRNRGMPYERTCLHLIRLQMEPNEVVPNGLDVHCPLPSDMMDLLEQHLPQVLQEAEPLVAKEGIHLRPDTDSAKDLPYEVFIE